ncbi:hypothetical protein E0Z10_g706 [Xylaria hypoxylon]|uniref:C2H2-type domain-containing protein n=1 Tax=Xylaria hypoxylon TaxID=37992 RepID=A0A4Z0ZGJ7_9PEZI|nr:hypothetical protein E0Z10_g706 [Xylaria hypoxylon]
MSTRQNPNYVPRPPVPRRRHHLTQETNARRFTGGCGPEPVVFNNPVPLDDSVYSALARRDSIWSDTSVDPLALRVETVFGGAGKFHGIEASDFPYAADPACMPSTASSVTGLSSISRTSSIGSVCSPVLSETTFESFHGSSIFRGPSPLRHSTKPSSDVVDPPGRSMPGCDVTQGENGLATQERLGHMHVCLWGSNGVCQNGGFATREELNRHVKMEHLLECPVLGCAETTFQTRDLLACHLKWDHNSSDTSNLTACRTANLLGASLASSHDAPNDSSAGKAVVYETNTIEDRALKMEMSIGISKKRCREQLRTVLEKRFRRMNGTSRSADSPGMVENRTPKLLESASFPVIWEHGVLPFLIEFMPKWCGPGHAISVVRGRKPNTRRISIMTRRPATKARRIVIASHVRDLLPETHRRTISFMFSTGKVDRLVWSRGLTEDMPDEVCAPRNPFAYISPCMGDSIGASLDDGEEATATLGPCVTAEGGSYWLACFHPFIGADRRTSPVLIEHPSPQDRAFCAQEQHDVLHDLTHQFGKMTASSGFNLKTTRITHDPYWEDLDKEPPLVVTDWILISSGTRQANLLRKFPNVAQRRETPITTTSSVSPCSTVISTGRTSGFQRGQVCDIPAYVDSQDNGTGQATREWFIEEPFPYDDENEWIRGGIGVEGDSGAAIVDSETNALVGQLWGRNKYWGPGPRITYFTPISDIFDDIQEKCGMSARPQLPQYRDEADRWPVYPVCKQCYDLREYLDSRRSSRESLMSMVGMHDPRGEHDNDLTSVSELATPKEQSYLVRHIGPEEVVSSLGGSSSVVSPAPVHAFYSFSQAASPGISELRSPYPQALSEDDLYETRCPQMSDFALGKRPAVLPPQGGGTTQHSEKRRKPTYANHP